MLGLPTAGSIGAGSGRDPAGAADDCRPAGTGSVRAGGVAPADAAPADAVRPAPGRRSVSSRWKSNRDTACRVS